MTKYGRKNLKWIRNDLLFQDKVLCSLIPSKKWKDHYHLKLAWRETETPEFFNITNARENAVNICVNHINKTYATEG